MNRTITTLVLFVTLGLSASTHAQVFGGSGPQSHDTVNFTVDAKFMMRFKVVAQDSNSGVTQYSATAGQVKLHVYGMLQNQSFNASTDVPFIFDEDHSRWSLTVTQSGRDVQVASESKLVVTNAEGETKETTDSFNSPGRADLKKDGTLKAFKVKGNTTSASLGITGVSASASAKIGDFTCKVVSSDTLDCYQNVTARGAGSL